MKQTFQSQQNLTSFYQFNDLDVDRYPIETPDGAVANTQVVLGVRELNTAGIPQKSWEGSHLAYTHGYGLALAPANATDENGAPNYLISDVPVSVNTDKINVDVSTPQTYYGENLPGYAVTNTERAEVDFEGEDAGQGAYSGSGGVVLDSFARKAAFALRFADWNLIVSNFLTSDSRIVFERDIRERVDTVAPFLQFDADPYPVLVDGRIVYMFDAYTTTSRYPNAQRADSSGLSAGSGLQGERFNYIRNSVKGVVDTYDGTVKLYVIDPDDPIIEAYQKAFPDLLLNMDDMPQELRAHWRFPEDMFRVQTNMYGRYHISDPSAFYEKTSAWSVAADPGSSVSGAGTTSAAVSQLVAGQATAVPRTNRIEPFYQLMRLPGEDRETFVMTRPYVPFSDTNSNERQVLTSFMVAKSDPEDYGKIIVYEMPTGQEINGPVLANSQILGNQAIASQLTLLNQQGSHATLGNMLLVPVNESILYVRPLYVSSDANPVPLLKQVIVVAGGQVTMKPTLRQAIETLFPGAKAETFESTTIKQPEVLDPNASPGSTTSTTSTSTTTVPPLSGGETVDQLVALASQALNQAEAALLAGNLGEYQAKVDEAQGYLSQAQTLSGTASTSTSSTTAPSTTAPSTTTTVAGTPA